ncbi:hypothetical protein EV401DRAFT_1892340 [Pisolithus croceorrhizus]|nr:hypothetical protein EV401DRAFT_1892340 [Pisolithus croceorrhizus]
MSYSCSLGAGAPGDWDQSQGNHGRHPKAVVQRKFRRREGEDFDELRDIIKQLNDHNPRTRRDILSEGETLFCCRRTLPTYVRSELIVEAPRGGKCELETTVVRDVSHARKRGKQYGSPSPTGSHRSCLWTAGGVLSGHSHLYP